MTEKEVIKFLRGEIEGLKEQRDGKMGEFAAQIFREIEGEKRCEVFNVAIKALEEIQQYREIGTVEECREAMNKLPVAEETIRKLLCSDYDSSCQFCIQNNDEDAICCNIGGSESWCSKNAKWNGRLE